jgi:hypothetical protein
MYMYNPTYRCNQEATAHVPGERSPRCGHESLRKYAVLAVRADDAACCSLLLLESSLNALLAERWIPLQHGAALCLRTTNAWEKGCNHATLTGSGGRDQHSGQAWAVVAPGTQRALSYIGQGKT